MPILTAGSRSGVAFIVSCGAVWECIAFACSSPQTAELNIVKRGDTLMKWVHLGQGLSFTVIVAAAIMDKQDRGPILAGGLYAMITAEAFYVYAKQSGLKNPGPMTEDY